MNGYLLDENLPHRLTFTPTLPITHATQLAASPTDTVLWEHARIQRLAIVSKDADSYRMLTLISYELQTVAVEGVLTHAEYSKNKWKVRYE